MAELKHTHTLLGWFALSLSLIYLTAHAFNTMAICLNLMSTGKTLNNRWKNSKRKEAKNNLEKKIQEEKSNAPVRCVCVCVLSMCQLMVYTSFSNASVPSAWLSNVAALKYMKICSLLACKSSFLGLKQEDTHTLKQQ